MTLPVPAALRGLPRETWVLALVAFCVALGFGIVVPAVPLFALHFGVGTTAAGAVVSAFALMRLVSGIGAGRFVDRVGERLALQVGLGVVALSSLLAGLAVSYPQLLVLRGLGGVGSAVFTISSTSLLLRVAAAAQRGRTQSIYRGGFLVGGIIGPAFGGAVLGLSIRAPFFLYAGTLGLAMLAAGALLPKPPPRAATGAPQEPRTPLPAALRNPAYRAALAANFALGFSLFGVRATLVPLLVVTGLGLGTGWIGAAFTLGAVVQTALLLPAGRFVDDVGRRPALLIGGALTAAGLASLAAATGGATLLAGMTVLALGGSLLGVAPAAVVGDVVSGRGGTAVAVWQMASDLGAVLGPVVAGQLVDRTSFTTALAVSAVVVAVCVLPSVRVPAHVPAQA